MTEQYDAPPSPTDAITMLQADHRKIAQLFANYEHARDWHTKQLLAEQVFTELLLHAQLEEHIFYPAYETMTGKNGTQLVADSRLDHEQVRALIIELRDTALAQAEFEEKFTELRRTVREHVATEEHEMFPEAAIILADRLEELRDDMVELQQLQKA